MSKDCHARRQRFQAFEEVHQCENEVPIVSKRTSGAKRHASFWPMPFSTFTFGHSCPRKEKAKLFVYILPLLCPCEACAGNGATLLCRRADLSRAQVHAPFLPCSPLPSLALPCPPSHCVAKLGSSTHPCCFALRSQSPIAIPETLGELERG